MAPETLARVDRRCDPYFRAVGRFDPKYTADQRDAIASAMIDGGMSAPAAVKAAAEGLDGLEPFTMPESTARDITAEARQHRTAKPADPDYEAALRDFLERGIAISHRYLTAVEAAQQQGNEPSSQQLTRMTKVFRMLNVLYATWRTAQSKPASPHPIPPAETDAVAEMLARLETVPNGNGVRHDDEEE